MYFTLPFHSSEVSVSKSSLFIVVVLFFDSGQPPAIANAIKACLFLLLISFCSD